jgi:pimeloyl-ACP methyl ester carboxylesterase
MLQCRRDLALAFHAQRSQLEESMQTATIDDIQLSYHDLGQGRPVILIHAFPLNSAMWEPQIAELKDGLRLIVPDLRGFGRSELGDPPLSLRRYADDIVMLLDTLGIRRATMAGVSMGGYIILAMLEPYLDRIESLILADTRAGADTDEAREGRLQSAQLAEAQGALAVGEPMLAKLLSPGAPEALRQEVRAIIAANQGPGVAAAQRSMAARPDSTALLEQVTVPALVVVGADDALTPPREAHTLHAGIKNSQLVEIPGAGHLANIEAPEAFNAAVLAFLGGMAPAGV